MEKTDGPSFQAFSDTNHWQSGQPTVLRTALGRRRAVGRALGQTAQTDRKALGRADSPGGQPHNACSDERGFPQAPPKGSKGCFPTVFFRFLTSACDRGKPFQSDKGCPKTSVFFRHFGAFCAAADPGHPLNTTVKNNSLLLLLGSFFTWPQLGPFLYQRVPHQRPLTAINGHFLYLNRTLRSLRTLKTVEEISKCHASQCWF